MHPSETVNDIRVFFFLSRFSWEYLFSNRRKILPLTDEQSLSKLFIVRGYRAATPSSKEILGDLCKVESAAPINC